MHIAFSGVLLYSVVGIPLCAVVMLHSTAASWHVKWQRQPSGWHSCAVTVIGLDTV